MDAILQVDNLTKQYADFKLDHVSFSVPKGTIMGLIGENGAGKSTTINAILDLIRKDDGTAKTIISGMCWWPTRKRPGENIKMP